MNTSTAEQDRRHVRVAIIGAGPGGICMAIKLMEAGIDDFVVIEKAAGVGGTWFHNRYPGCACDVPSHLYSFSFELKADWTRPYAPQPEILEYFERTAETYGVLSHCRFETEVVGAQWDDKQSWWTIETDDGSRLEAEIVVGAIGMFNEPFVPPIDGLDDFEGTIFHSSRWDWDHDLTGEAVGVIGSAASAVQLMPEIAKEVAQVHLFQRSANWVLPKLDTPYTEEELDAFRDDPAAVQAMRQVTYDNFEVGSTFGNPVVLAEREAAGLGAIAAVEDPDVRDRLVPTHPFGCKRPLFSNYFYPAFNRPNVELVTDAVERVTSDAIVTADGTARPVDTLIVATGFATTRYMSTISVTGRNGLPLDDAWADGAQAYVGITTAGFPNMFMLYGPNTNNGSIITMIEHQVAHVMRHIERLDDEHLAWVDVRPEVMEAYNDELQDAIAGVKVWNAGCNGYYRSPSGRIVTQWPFSMKEYGDRTATLDLDAFEVASREAS